MAVSCSALEMTEILIILLSVDLDLINRLVSPGIRLQKNQFNETYNRFKNKLIELDVWPAAPLPWRLSKDGVRDLVTRILEAAAKGTIAEGISTEEQMDNLEKVKKRVRIAMGEDKKEEAKANTIDEDTTRSYGSSSNISVASSLELIDSSDVAPDSPSVVASSSLSCPFSSVSNISSVGNSPTINSPAAIIDLPSTPSLNISVFADGATPRMPNNGWMNGWKEDIEEDDFNELD